MGRTDAIGQACQARPPLDAPAREADGGLVEVTGVNHHFGRGESLKQVLFDNTLKIKAGEIVIMTGPSGSGKTTLLTLIGALRSLQDGSIKAFGRELAGLSYRDQIMVRRDIGFIFQHHNLFESLSAFQNVRLASEVLELPPRETRQRSEAILNRLGLADRMYYKPQKLSGGQRQRVAIGRALVNNPRLVLADEPTAALDKDTGREVVTIFQELAESRGSSVLIVTHDNRILDVADRIVSMVDGYIVSNLDVSLSLELLKFLAKCPAFEGAHPTFLADAAGKMVAERYPAGTEVICQGEIGDKFYVVRSGHLEVLKRTGEATEKVLSYGPGDFFGELALLKEQPRAATVRSLDEVELYSMEKHQFQALVEASHNFEEQLRKTYFYK